MKTDNRDSEKDLNANPESRLNTNKPVTRPERFPESLEARDEIVNKDHPGKGNEGKDRLKGVIFLSV